MQGFFWAIILQSPNLRVKNRHNVWRRQLQQDNFNKLPMFTNGYFGTLKRQIRIALRWSHDVSQIKLATVSVKSSWLFKRVTRLNLSELKLGNTRVISTIFKIVCLAKKDLKDNKHNGLHLGQKYPRIFVLGHYLFLVAHSSPLGRGQISQHIFAPNGGYCLYIQRALVE